MTNQYDILIHDLREDLEDSDHHIAALTKANQETRELLDIVTKQHEQLLQSHNSLTAAFMDLCSIVSTKRSFKVVTRDVPLPTVNTDSLPPAVFTIARFLAETGYEINDTKSKAEKDTSKKAGQVEHKAHR